MAKLHFVRYSESREQLRVSASDVFVMTVSFSAGMRTTRNCGYKRKKDALAHVEKVNRAAGIPIAEYGGSLEPTPQVW